MKRLSSDASLLVSACVGYAYVTSGSSYPCCHTSYREYLFIVLNILLLPTESFR